MPSNQNISLKTIKLGGLLLLSPLFLFSQTLTGLWTGTFSNDSNSVRKDQSYEIALTEYRGKVFGYSRCEFIVRDTLYYVVKRVKGTINGDVCEVKDVEILSDNFPARPDKGVKVSSFFYRNKKDSTWFLAGNWKTNATKRYYSVTGKIELKEEKDLAVSKLFPHLEELNLGNDVAFYQEKKKENIPVVMKQAEPEKKVIEEKEMVATISKPEPKEEPQQETIIPDESSTRIKERASLYNSSDKSGSVAKINPAPPNSMKPIGSGPQKPVIKPEETVIADESSTRIKERASLYTSPSKEGSVAKINPASPTSMKPIGSGPQKPVTKPEQTAATQEIAKVQKKEDQPKQAVQTTVEEEDDSWTVKIPQSKTTQATTSNTIAKTTNIQNTKQPGKAETSIALKPASHQSSIIAPVTNSLPEPVQVRKSEFSQYVTFKSDSLELALYDNGEIDGDTVSIYLNGEIILSRQCLKATAIKKTIYLTPGKDDEFNLVLFADNLGKYPPNTGLLVVHDGDDVYNLRFSADYEKNAGVLFKRKK